MPKENLETSSSEVNQELNNEQNSEETTTNEEIEEKAAIEEKSQEEIKIEELEEKIKELQDKILRNAAEYENIKKRMEREKKSAVDYASERFAHDLLSVIDSLENGAKSFEGSGDNELFDKVKEGFDLILNQFQKVFEKHGINPIELKDFDPNFHNAIMQIDSGEHNSGEIVQTLQKGYTINDRVLRAAMVSIAK